MLSGTVITSLGEDGAGCCAVWHCDHFTRGRWSWLLGCLSSIVITTRGRWSWLLCCLSSIVITSLGEDGAGCCAASHCDHFTREIWSWLLYCLSSIVITTRGRWSWLLYWLSSVVITSLGEDGAGCLAVCLALRSLH